MKNTFPELKLVRPRKLIEALQKLPDFDVSLTGGPSGLLWMRLLERIKNGEHLSNLEKTQAMNNFANLPIELVSVFLLAFEKNLDPNVLLRSSKTLNLTLQPYRLANYLAGDSILKKFGNSHLTKGLYDNREYFKSNQATLFCDKLLESPNSIFERIREFAINTEANNILNFGQLEILRTLFTRANCHRLLDLDPLHLIGFSSCFPEQQFSPIQSIDRVLLSYMTAVANWHAQLLDKNNPLARFVYYLTENNTPANREILGSKVIQDVLSKLNELTNVISRLNEVEPDRGNFWRNYLKFADYVLFKKFPFPQKYIACAFAFQNIVVVEFAPTGNAAYIYDRETFENQIRTGSDWKKRELTKRSPGFSKDGRLFHQSAWQSHFSRFLQYHIRNGRQ